jgi:hypothetical protein
MSESQLKQKPANSTRRDHVGVANRATSAAAADIVFAELTALLSTEEGESRCELARKTAVAAERESSGAKRPKDKLNSMFGMLYREGVDEALHYDANPGCMEKTGNVTADEFSGLPTSMIVNLTSASGKALNGLVGVHVKNFPNEKRRGVRVCVKNEATGETEEKEVRIKYQNLVWRANYPKVFSFKELRKELKAAGYKVTNKTDDMAKHCANDAADLYKRYSFAAFQHTKWVVFMERTPENEGAFNGVCTCCDYYGGNQDNDERTERNWLCFVEDNFVRGDIETLDGTVRRIRRAVEEANGCCPICDEVFGPYIRHSLTCGHEFHSNCLATVEKSSKHQIECPVCQHVDIDHGVQDGIFQRILSGTLRTVAQKEREGVKQYTMRTEREMANGEMAKEEAMMNSEA